MSSKRLMFTEEVVKFDFSGGKVRQNKRTHLENTFKRIFQTTQQYIKSYTITKAITTL